MFPKLKLGTESIPGRPLPLLYEWEPCLKHQVGPDRTSTGDWSGVPLEIRTLFPCWCLSWGFFTLSRDTREADGEGIRWGRCIKIFLKIKYVVSKWWIWKKKKRLSVMFKSQILTVTLHWFKIINILIRISNPPILSFLYLYVFIWDHFSFAHRSHLVWICWQVFSFIFTCLL